MNVSQLRATLRSLVEILSSAGAAKQADEIRSLESALCDISPTETIATLVKRLHPPVKVAKPPKVKVSPQDVAARLKALDDRAADPTRNPDELVEALKALPGLTAAGLKVVAQALGVALSSKAKKDQIVDAIRTRLQARLGAVHRVEAAG
jgi:hypothetical protein